MKCSDCKEKMKVTRTIRLDDERTMRIYFCDSCCKVVESIELTCDDLDKNYRKNNQTVGYRR